MQVYLRAFFLFVLYLLLCLFRFPTFPPLSSLGHTQRCSGLTLDPVHRITPCCVHGTIRGARDWTQIVHVLGKHLAHCTVSSPIFSVFGGQLCSSLYLRCLQDFLFLDAGYFILYIAFVFFRYNFTVFTIFKPFSRSFGPRVYICNEVHIAVVFWTMLLEFYLKIVKPKSL